MGSIIKSTIIIIYFFDFCGGFLIDGNTRAPSSTGSVINDEHYNFLMQFIFQERKSRLQLEDKLEKLQEQVTAKETDLSAKLKELEKCGCPRKDHDGLVENRTILVEDKLESLTKEYATMKMNFIKLQQQHMVTSNKSAQLEKDVLTLKQIKAVSDGHVILDLQNVTKHLENEIQKTNNKNAALESDSNARKQDFLALFQKFQYSEKELQTLNKTSSNRIDNLETNQLASNISIQKTLREITIQDSRVNSIITAIQGTLTSMSNKALLSAFCSTYTVSSGSMVLFNNIRTSHGISDLSSMKASGQFTCEKTGYYLIAFSVSTNTANTRICISINGVCNSRASKHGDSQYETFSSILVSHLTKGDKVGIKADSDLNVWSYPDSVFTVLQIT